MIWLGIIHWLGAVRDRPVSDREGQEETVKPIPKSLNKETGRVTAESYRQLTLKFRQRRSRVIGKWRELGATDAEIGALLGVSTQYLYKNYPRNAGKVVES